MKRILFVDDEQNILDGLKRLFRPMREEWDMDFVTSGEEALAKLSLEPFDIIVADMRMPGMNGIELLTQVKDKYPDMVRLILSGHSDQELIMKSVPLAHQYLSKPCDAEVLKSTIDRAFQLRTALKNEKLLKLTSHLTSIPTLPALYNDLMKELQEPEPSIQNVSQIIEKDVGMTAKILQLINSAFFGLQRTITGTEEAVNYLGLNIIRALVLTIEIFEQFSETRCRWFHIEQLMNHSLRCAGLARDIAKDLKLHKTIVGNTFMAGILHDMGKLLLAVNLPKEYDEVDGIVNHNHPRFHEAEKLAFGASHGEIGAYLLGIWGFPDSILEAVAFHHNPNDSPYSGFTPLTAVHIANALVWETEPDEGDKSPEQEESLLNLEYITRLGYADKLETWRALARKTA